jgi:hypothetical protein
MKGAKMYKFIKLLVVIAIFVALSACATPTISDHLQLVNITLPPGDPNANINLTRVIGGGIDYGRDVTCDADDTCTLFGFTFKSFGETTDFLAIHLNASGTATWARAYGGTNKDELWRVIKTKDQGHLLIGTSESLFFTGLKVFSPQGRRRPFILKLDKDGHMQWSKTLEIRYADASLLNATQDSEGNYILVGKLYVNLKLPDQRSKEEQQWQWQGENLNLDKAWQDVLDKTEYRRDILVLKLAANGRPIFMNRYIPNKNLSIGSSVSPLPNGHALIADQEEELSANIKYPGLLEIDSNGVPVRAESFKSGMYEYPNFILRQPGGGVILAGTTSRSEELPKIFSLWLDKEGVIQNARLYSNPKGLQVMNTVLGHNDKLSIAARTFKGDTKTEAGVAFTANDNGIIDNSVALSGQGNIELDGIWPLARGGYRLLGDAAGFGATYVNIITAIWTSNTKADFPISESGYAPTVAISKIYFMSGDLSSVTDIPVSLVKMTEISVSGN